MAKHSFNNLNVHFIRGNIPFIVKLHNNHFQTFHICIYAKFKLSNNVQFFVVWWCFFLLVSPPHIHTTAWCFPIKINGLDDI